MTRVVLFDIDGTLIRTGGAGVRAFARTAELAFGRAGGTATLRFHGRTDTSLVREFLGLHDFADTPDLRDHFLATYLFLLDEELERQRGETCPGVRELIASLRALPNPPLIGLLTGNVRVGAALKLAAHGLDSDFLLGAFGDDHENRNELAAIAQKRAAQMLGAPVAGAEIIVIGDTLADIECAHAIGARCVAVATGGDSLPQLLAHSPALALNSLADVSAERLLAAGQHWERPTDWEALYQARDTRWDKGEPTPALVDFLREHPEFVAQGGTVAVPGCGRGHDARAWAKAGFHAQGFDFAPTAIAEANAADNTGLEASFYQADFLAGKPPRPFDWLFEHTLFCAIPPARRDDYVRSVARWVSPGGHYLAVNYLQPQDEFGPPFGATVSELLARFSPQFELVKHWVPRSFPGRTGRERCFLWRRR
jgi:phosphoglycolate phosphatase-like HAD superfamily hydrolase